MLAKLLTYYSLNYAGTLGAGLSIVYLSEAIHNFTSRIVSVDICEAI